MDTATVSIVNSYILFELITEILSRLLVKSLIRFLRVYSYVFYRWYDLIHDPYFINIHLKNSIDSGRDRTIIVTEIARSYCYPKLPVVIGTKITYPSLTTTIIVSIRPWKFTRR
ncbi:hypothetical protein CFP56_035307 [Quercus suber]|uniref:Maturase K n=1 Tax=Quercus suber TaxID=58331 RepID=A0AAW0J9V6_QUESU